MPKSLLVGIPIGFYDGDGNRKPTDKVFVGFNDSLTKAPLSMCSYCQKWSLLS